MSRSGTARLETGAPSRGRIMREFEWNDLRFFLAIARFGTFTAGAQQLPAPPPAVSVRFSSLPDRPVSGKAGRKSPDLPMVHRKA
jgi:hypothetical protein